MEGEVQAQEFDFIKNDNPIAFLNTLDRDIVNARRLVHRLSLYRFINSTPSLLEKFPDPKSREIRPLENAWTHMCSIIGKDNIEIDPVDKLSRITNTFAEMIMTILNNVIAVFSKIDNIYKVVCTSTKELEILKCKVNSEVAVDKVSSVALEALKKLCVQITDMNSFGEFVDGCLESVCDKFVTCLDDYQLVNTILQTRPEEKDFAMQRNKVGQINNKLRDVCAKVKQNSNIDLVIFDDVEILMSQSNRICLQNDKIRVDEEQCEDDNQNTFDKCMEYAKDFAPNVRVDSELSNEDETGEGLENEELVNPVNVEVSEYSGGIPIRIVKTFSCNAEAVQTNSQIRETLEIIPNIKQRLRQRVPVKIKSQPVMDNRKSKGPQMQTKTHQNVTCRICDTSFVNEGVFERHMRAVHLKQGGSKCRYCKIKFKRKDYLERHLNFHCKKKPK